MSYRNVKDAEFEDTDDEGVELNTSVVGAIGLTLALLIYCAFGIFTVDASERAVMFRFGNPVGIKEPGLSWHAPLIEDYIKVNLTGVRRVVIGAQNTIECEGYFCSDTVVSNNQINDEKTMLTGDLNIINMAFVVQYDLSDPEKYLFENRFAWRDAGDVVKQVAETSMRGVVGSSPIDYVLYEGRQEIASKTKDDMQKILNKYNTGINVREVAVQNVQPPEEVQKAFEDAIKARQDRERKINEGHAYANNIVPRAEGQAARLINNAEAYKESVTQRARGATKRFSDVAEEYNRAPDVTRRRMYLETIEEVFGSTNKIIVDNKDSKNILYLPLDKLSGNGRKNSSDEDNLLHRGAVTESVE